MNLPCILCDLQSEGRGDFGWVHDRSQWPFANQECMAAAHGLTWNALRGGWVPMPMDREWSESQWLDEVEEVWD